MEPEDHIDRLCAVLRAQLPAQIGIVNAAKADGIIVPTSVVVVAGGKQPMPELNDQQAVLEVALPDETLDGFDISQTDWDASLTVVVRAWLMHVGDPDTGVEFLYRKSLRMRRALVAVVAPIDNDAFGNHASLERVRIAYRVNPETDQREEFVSGTLFVMSVMDVS